MNGIPSNVECSLKCTHHGGCMCVANLVSLPGQNAPISLGLHVGLKNAYGKAPIPPCVRGPLGAAYWSTESSAVADEKPNRRQLQTSLVSCIG